MGLLNPNRRKWAILFFVILVVHLGHGIFHPGSGFIFLQIGFWVKTCLKLPKLKRSLRKTVVRLHGSTRRLPSFLLRSLSTRAVFSLPYETAKWKG